ncbi:hypothetical protein [Burkholderia cepacia]|uniref:hypothetical protein n=1 Tax=Burkholderia cepacia TaxID=292 RepID=UPI0007592CA6|nr:hypothetical protein [Burkholderia cepacia]KVL18693.1 hypothetical protein WJ46_16755 [Burkholderia cepacia]KVQ25842.1 hypothetical protein WK02_27235 [Burkholderia cepacia]
MSWHHGDWLSFAQAAASAAAILGAFGVVFLQHHLEGIRRRAAEHADARRVLTIAYEFTKKAWIVVSKVSNLLSNPDRVADESDWQKYRSELYQSLEALNGLPINVLPTAEAAEQIIRARSELASACFEADKTRANHEAGSLLLAAPWRKWEARLADVMKILSQERDKFPKSK